MKIIFYEDRAGRIPVREFLDSLDINMRQKMLRSIQALQDMGVSLRMPLSESLDDGIFELRAKVGTNISRVMYWQSGSSDTWVYQKNTKNTAPGDRAR